MKTLRSLHISLTVTICLCFAAAPAFGQAGSGSLAGSVFDQSNKPVAGAFIAANRNTLPPASGRTTSAADGTFQISGLPAGSYTVCAQVAGGGFVNDCDWSASPPTVNVTAGQQSAGLQVTLKKGAILQVRLNDPGSLLKASSPGQAVPHVLMGVQTTRGLLLPVTLVSTDAGGTTHTVTVPFGTALQFAIFSDHASLTNATGAPAGAAGSTVPFTAPSGANSTTLTFNVTGLK